MEQYSPFVVFEIPMHRDRPPVEVRHEEVSFIDLWHVLLRRKKWIIAMLVASIAGGAVYLVFAPKLYEARVKVRVGQVAGAGSFEAPEILASRLLAKYGEDVADGVKRPRPFLKQASVPRYVPASVELVAQADSPDDAAAFLERVFAEVQHTHDETFRENFRLMSERIRSLEAQRDSLKQQFQEASDLIDRLRPRDPVQASLVMLERGRISATLNGLEAEKPELAQRLTPPKTQPTALLGEIIAPQRAAAPRRSLVLTISLALGLVAGVALAFIIDFLSQTRDASLHVAPTS